MEIPLEDTTLFADDQVILTGDYDDAEYILRKLIDGITKRELELNLDKAKHMAIGAENKDLVTQKEIVRNIST